jgi:hypothetical protein
VDFSLPLFRKLFTRTARNTVVADPIRKPVRAGFDMVVDAVATITNGAQLTKTRIYIYIYINIFNGHDQFIISLRAAF